MPDDGNVKQMPGTTAPMPPNEKDAARSMAALYQTLLVEGFTPREALYLVASVARGGPKDPPE